MKYGMFLAIVCCTIPLEAKQEQEAFLKAGQLYQDGQIREAYELYESLPIKSAGTLYNMGNCAYRLGQPGRALGYWLQSLTLAPRFMYPWLLQNIKKTQDELGLPELKGWHVAVLYIHTYMRLLFAQLCVVLLLGLLLVLWFFGRLRIWSAVVLGFLVTLFVALTIMTYYAWYRTSVIVIEKGCALYTGPDEQFPTVKEITVGSRARVADVQDSWYKISYQKERGWIKKSCVMTVT